MTYFTTIPGNPAAFFEYSGPHDTKINNMLPETLTAFLLGGLAYVLLELAWRGRSHISMFVTGGAAFALLHGLFVRYPIPLFYKCLAGMVLITALEFIAGCTVNLLLKRKVWDYSRVPGNLYGQVCLGYSLLWGLLTLPIAYLSALLHALYT